MLSNRKREITPEVISTFLDGHDPQERIVNFDYKGQNNYITILYRDKDDNKCETTEPFYPFLWATREACDSLKTKSKGSLSALMKRYHIWVKPLDVTNNEGKVVEEIIDGYTFMFYATQPISYYSFLDFFKKAGNPVYEDRRKSKGGGDAEDSPVKSRSNRQYLVVPPVEQYMIASGKRMFKGYEDYDDLLRLIFDLETTGLDTEHDRIEQFGFRFNRPVKYKGKYMDFAKTYRTEGDTEEEKDRSELHNIDTMLRIIYTFRPDIITAHNGENFDWNIIIGACRRLGTTIEEMSEKYFNGESITKSKRETILKLGGEIETYRQTIVPKTIITDSLHAVRRAQALDSNMASSGLKYVTKYSNIVKPDRVYVPGDKISEIWNDTSHRYMFCDEDGDWYVYNPDYVSPTQDEAILRKKGKSCDTFKYLTKNFVMDGYSEVDGKYIVNRYLLDDLWECDKVEHRYNSTNFLICKMLPLPFQKCCTMGTAGQWKAMLMAWSYENDLAIPMFGERKTFTGGLSRLLKVGYIPNVAKFDYNSLYPSIVLTWAIQTPKDLMGSMLVFLEHVLTQREKYKKLKKEHGKLKEKYKDELKECSDKTQADELSKKISVESEMESANDKKQLPLKVFGNSFFGSYGAPNIFPWGDTDCAERTTCTGRQALRLMISHFSNIGRKYPEMIDDGNPDDYNYSPVVGDSFTPDTPIFIKYDSGLINIVAIEEIVDSDKIHVDAMGREYDYSEKEFSVLCRSGWMKPHYIYRHKTEKDIYEVKDGKTLTEVTEDHSLFDSEQKKIKPSEINGDTELEYYKHEIRSEFTISGISHETAGEWGAAMAKGIISAVPIDILNSGEPDVMKSFLREFRRHSDSSMHYSKKCLAGIQYIENICS